MTNRRLERLLQERGELSRLTKQDGSIPKFLSPVGKIQTFVLSYDKDIQQFLDGMAEQGSLFIPKTANAYVSSDFNPDTSHLRGKCSRKKVAHSVYAVQFYRIP